MVEIEEMRDCGGDDEGVRDCGGQGEKMGDCWGEEDEEMKIQRRD